MGVAALISASSANGKRSGEASVIARRATDIGNYSNFINMNRV